MSVDVLVDLNGRELAPMRFMPRVQLGQYKIRVKVENVPGPRLSDGEDREPAE